MPVYELFCLAQPLPKTQIAEIIKKASSLVLANNGVLADLKSFGEQQLAYDIRKKHGVYETAHIWALHFVTNPQVMKEMDYSLRIDERVLRYMFSRKRSLPAYPTTAAISKALELGFSPQLALPYQLRNLEKLQRLKLEQETAPVYRRE